MSGQVPYENLLAPHVGAEEAARLARYAELLERWSARHSLVRFADRRELVERHLLDARAGASAMGDTGRLLDVGSGAGLPGVPLLVARPGWQGVLLEPRTKRWAFLRTVIRELGLAAEAVCSRYRELPPGGRWDCITARAVGGHEELLEWAREVLSEDGEVVLWTTVDTEVRLAALPRWRVLSSALPGLERGRLCRLQPCFT